MYTQATSNLLEFLSLPQAHFLGYLALVNRLCDQKTLASNPKIAQALQAFAKVHSLCLVAVLFLSCQPTRRYRLAPSWRRAPLLAWMYSAGSCNSVSLQTANSAFERRRRTNT